MTDVFAWLCGDLWRWVLACALILAAGALVAALAWIVVFALMALRNRLKDLNNHNNVAKRRKR